MSAFVVSHDHIDALLTFAADQHMLNQLAYIVDKQNPLSWSRIGQVLLAENERSVNHRYPSDISDNALEYKFKPFQELSLLPRAKMLAWILNGCACFDYQACETDDYEQSIAHKLIRAIEAKAIRELPHMDDAPWCIDRSRTKQAAR